MNVLKQIFKIENRMDIPQYLLEITKVEITVSNHKVKRTQIGKILPFNEFAHINHVNSMPTTVISFRYIYI